MKRFLTRLVLSLVMLVGLSLVAQSVSASNNSISIKGLTLTPAIEQIELRPGQASFSYPIRLDNNLGSSLSININSLDFKSLNDTGGLFFIGAGASSAQDKYGLANWISLPASPIILSAHGGQFINVTVDNRADLSPGGHYAAILFHVNGQSGSGVNRVDLNQVASSLLFVRKTGGEKYSLTLTNVQLHRNIFGWPRSADLFFSNTGNVQTAPYGTIDLDGSLTIINPGSSLVLPGSSRVLITPLSASSGSILPGSHHLKIKYRPDGLSQFSSYDVSFLYVNLWGLIIAAIALWIIFELYGHRYELRARSVKLSRILYKIRRR